MTIERIETDLPLAHILGIKDARDTLQPGTTLRYRIFGKVTVIDEQSVAVQMPLSPKNIHVGSLINKADLTDPFHCFPPGRITKIVWVNNTQTSTP